MTPAYWCVLAAAALPYVFTSLAKFSGKDFGPRQNKQPREFLEELSGWRKRAHWAQLNSFEAFPPFAAAVIIASVAGAEPSTVNWLAVGFVAARAVYGAFYIADWGLPRTLAWSAGVGCVVGLFIAAA